jgi:hypothetical protein
MDDINKYLQKKFKKLPVSHQNFIPTARIFGVHPPRLVGNEIHTKYLILYIDFDSLYKPVTAYL